MTTATAAQRPDTFEMVLVHNTFRRGFGALPALVRAVPAGDAARAAVVVGFLTDLGTGLHHHHTGEDELMWPLLLDRAPMDGALILRMEEQHERLAEINDRAGTQSAAFAATADPAAGAALAATLEHLVVALDEHLRDEEQQILPLVERAMTVPEWRALGERGRATIPKDRQLVFLGFLLQGVPADRRRQFLADLPVSARLAWTVLGRRAFRREYRRIFGHDPQ